MEEAYTLAAEANKTLAEAKAAVAKVRAAGDTMTQQPMLGRRARRSQEKRERQGTAWTLLDMWVTWTYLPELC